MKKFILVLLCIALMLSLAACSNEAAGNNEEGAAAEGEEFVMATNAAFPPYEFVEGSEYAGIDVEIAGAIAEKLGKTLKVEDMEFDSIIEAVKGGKADIGMAGMTVTPERELEVNFTVSYVTGRQVVIVTDGSVITSVGDLFDIGGYNIGVQRNTTGDLYTTWDLEDEGLATVERYSKAADAVQALMTGKVDCVIIDDQPAKHFVEELDGLHILETEYVEEHYAGAMSKDNTEEYEAVNNALQELIDDGTVQGIIDKYINAD